MRRPGPLNNGKPLHPIHPDGKTRSDDFVLDEIRPTAGVPQGESHERIDREVHRREVVGQIVGSRVALL
jgi:hypothetical protein